MKLDKLLAEVDRKLEACAKNSPGAHFVLEQSALLLIPDLARRLQVAEMRLSKIAAFGCIACNDGVKCGHE